MGFFDIFKKQQAQESAAPKKEKAERNQGLFAGSILLSEPTFDFDAFVEELGKHWDIALSGDDAAHDGETMVFYVDGMMAAVSLFPSPVPNDEAVNNAKTNYRWRGAVQVAEQHKAHVFIAVMSGDKPLTDAGILLVRLCAAALAQETATGIYTAGTVFEPDFYRAYAAFYFENDLYPVMNLVFFGLYSRDNGDTWCSYTYGMKNTFLKDEFEVFDTKHTPEELIEFMSDVASYVIEEDATLRPGQTIGFTQEQKLPITRSPSDVLEGETLKIEF